MKWHDLTDNTCPLARAMGVIGDRWTLLILRECFLGVRRFDGFQKRLGVTRHLLAERLKRLETMGLLERRPYQERPLRHEYRLTNSGKEFAPVLLAMQDWALHNLPSAEPAPFAFVTRDGGTKVDPVVTDRLSGQELNHRTVLMVPSKVPTGTPLIPAGQTSNPDRSEPDDAAQPAFSTATIPEG